MPNPDRVAAGQTSGEGGAAPRARDRAARRRCGGAGAEWPASCGRAGRGAPATHAAAGGAARAGPRPDRQRRRPGQCRGGALLRQPAEHSRRARDPRQVPRRAGGDEPGGLRARACRTAGEGARCRPGLRAGLDAAVSCRMHVRHERVRARLRPRLLRRTLSGDEAVALLRQPQQHTLPGSWHAPGDAAGRQGRGQREGVDRSGRSPIT